MRIVFVLALLIPSLAGAQTAESGSQTSPADKPRAHLSIINQKNESIDECFATLTKEPSQHPGVRVKFVVSKEGTPTLMIASEAENPDLTKCVLDVVATVKFPPGPRDVLMNYNFAFKQEFPPHDGSSYNKEFIRQVIGENEESIQHCHDIGLKEDPGLHGNIQTKFYIWYDGTVLKSTIESSTLNNPDVELCIQEAILGMRFPEPPLMVVVAYPLDFKTKGKGHE